MPYNPHGDDPDADLLICVHCGAIMAWALDDSDHDGPIFTCPNSVCPLHEHHQRVIDQEPH